MITIFTTITTLPIFYSIFKLSSQPRRTIMPIHIMPSLTINILPNLITTLRKIQNPQIHIHYRNALFTSHLPHCAYER